MAVAGHEDNNKEDNVALIVDLCISSTNFSLPEMSIDDEKRDVLEIIVPRFSLQGTPSLLPYSKVSAVQDPIVVKLQLRSLTILIRNFEKNCEAVFPL